MTWDGMHIFEFWALGRSLATTKELCKINYNFRTLRLARVYGLAKAFVSTLTRVLAKELTPSRVRVNAVAPGVTMTPLHERESSFVQIAVALSTTLLGRSMARKAVRSMPSRPKRSWRLQKPTRRRAGSDVDALSA
jgi:NAD(P)-dependent dehydrogenase (short-subunit alcohol dehydrogenase family)